MTPVQPTADDRDRSPPAKQRRPAWTLLCLSIVLLPLALLPWVIHSAAESWKHNNNDLMAWADDALPIKKEFQTFVEYFGRPELIVVSWPDCESDSEQLAALADAMSDETNRDWFVNVATTKSILDELKKVPGSASEARIRYQMRGVLVGRDGKQACLTAELGARGRQQRHEAINRIKALTVAQGLTADDVKIGGIGAELAWMDHDSVAGPASMLPYIALLSVVLCVIAVRSLIVGLFITLLGSFTGVLSAALIHWCGVQSNAVTATLPTLGGLLAISLSLHFLAYYRNAMKKIREPDRALRQAYRWAFRPTVLSATTTAIGLGSLLLSRTVTIRQFGAFGAMITICAAILALTVLPAFLSLTSSFHIRHDVGKHRRRWLAWGMILQRNAKLIVVSVIAVAILLALGFAKLKTGIHVDNLFVKRHEIIHSDRWLESHIGPLASIEVVVGFARDDPPDSAAKAGDDLAKCLLPLQALTDHLRISGQFDCVVSAATGLPDMQKMQGFRGVAARVRLRRWLDANRDRLQATGLYAETDSEQLWRISVRIPAMTDVPTSDLCAALEHQVDQFLEDHRREKGESARPIRYFVTGLPLLFEQIEDQFIDDLMLTYLTGLALITLAVFLVLRSANDAVVAMIPNVLPAVAVLGGLSLIGIELDVGSVMTASIALGVAVDDTLHFVLWFQKDRRRGLTPSEAVQTSIVHCGSPILQTSLICGLGMALLAFAPFLPTVRFGSLIAMMLGVALIGDLLFLPAMLSLQRDDK